MGDPGCLSKSLSHKETNWCNNIRRCLSVKIYGGLLDSANSYTA